MISNWSALFAVLPVVEKLFSVPWPGMNVPGRFGNGYRFASFTATGSSSNVAATTGSLMFSGSVGG